ncbi:MAG TPA: DUF362 domain-containing protein [Deferrisomatales bacterium]|nr:DUF362 domain-containing protein [Deferrisomatales bacterium]
MHRVLIHPATYETIRHAVDRAFEVLPQTLKGKRVLLKPNVLRAGGPEEGVTTHPAVLRAVVDKVEALGPAELVVGDNPGVFSYGANEEAFRQTGLMEAAKGYYRNIGEDSRGVAFHPAFMASVSVSSAVLDADVVISLPKFKTHGLTVVSGAIKNSYGILPGGVKARLHRAAGNPVRFHDLVVEVFRLRVPDLFIMDAVVGMEGNGPVSPDLRDVGLLLAADNAVALDSVVATMMGCAPGKLGFLRKARELGLGDYDLGNVEILGELKRLPGFKLPPLGGEANQDNPEIQGHLLRGSQLRPGVDPELCTGCGRCVEQCPVSALAMGDGIPQVDADACITCFCCQELCPERAITLT